MLNKTQLDFSKIKLIILDLEGVLLQKNEPEDDVISQLQNFVRDLKQLNCKVCIITAGKNKIIKKLNSIENLIILDSALDKLTTVQKLLNSVHVNFDNVFYIGDEVFDIPLLVKCGISAAPKTASRTVKRNVNIIIDNSSTEKLLNSILSYKKSFSI
ncbi:HAD hydrolase family protein [Melioribacteraceae bacterium 4301-Me]|uniref:HAD hydrolase family protein n=1 Tax=Pyranulibacter aquaticus TaxID=3163344 RepID=UPI00359957E5